MNENEVKREQAMTKTGAKRQKRRRRLRWQFMAVLAVFLISVVAALCLTVLFPVQDIVVKGESRYNDEQIVNVSAVEMGSNLILLDSDRVCTRILEQLPYIGKCGVEKALDGTVTLTVSELPAVRAYQNADGYCLVNGLEKVLETVDEDPQDICVVLGAEAENTKVGLSYQPNDAVRSRLENLIKTAAEHDLELTRIDLTDAQNLRFVVENRLMIEFGSEADFTYKMAHLATTLDSMRDTDEGTLDLSWWSVDKKDAYFRRGDIMKLIYGADYVDPNAPVVSQPDEGESPDEESQEGTPDGRVGIDEEGDQSDADSEEWVDHSNESDENVDDVLGDDVSANENSDE